MVEILTKTNEIAFGLNGALIFSNPIEFEYWKTSEVDNVAFFRLNVQLIQLRLTSTIVKCAI